MKKNVLIFGLIAGAIVTAMMLFTMTRMNSGVDIEPNTFLGYASMVLAFSLIFVGIRNYRNNYNGGIISFKKAFKVGLLITLVASTVYVVAWLITYYLFMPDFMDTYTACVLRDAKADGATAAELSKKSQDMAQFGELYKNPLFVVLITYTEIFPVGLVISLVAALILKRKMKPADASI